MFIFNRIHQDIFCFFSGEKMKDQVRVRDRRKKKKLDLYFGFVKSAMR
jgi:hypothetical protein